MPKKRPTLPAKYSDMGTPELRQHYTIVKEDADKHTQRARNITQAPLDWYLAHSHITHEQWQAGDRLFQSFTYAGLFPSTVVTYMDSGTKGTGGQSFTDTQIAARKRLYTALDQLEREGQQLVIHVCCLGDWPSITGTDRRYAVARLRSALHELAIYFGLIKTGEKR